MIGEGSQYDFHQTILPFSIFIQEANSMSNGMPVGLDDRVVVDRPDGLVAVHDHVERLELDDLADLVARRERLPNFGDAVGGPGPGDDVADAGDLRDVLPVDIVVPAAPPPPGCRHGRARRTRLRRRRAGSSPRRPSLLLPQAALDHLPSPRSRERGWGKGRVTSQVLGDDRLQAPLGDGRDRRTGFTQVVEPGISAPSTTYSPG